MSEEKISATYKQAGVDIDAGEKAVDLIRELTRSTFSPRVMTDIGGFGGLFSIKGLGGGDPVLVSGTDGVGTKLKIAFMTGRHDTIGIDAVAMCVNDVICTGAQPLFFLDYLATSRIEPEKVRDIISGMSAGCRQAGCALIGGEMAEMPGFYADGEYDIAGFCVGIVDRGRMIDGSAIQAGDSVIGLPSSGLHSNGFSLARKVFLEIGGFGVDDRPNALGGKTVGETMLEPTLIYAREIAPAVESGAVRGISHITGGGLIGNTVRALPAGRGLDIDWGSWPRPAVFETISRIGNVDEEEMRKVFNLGIGLTLITSPADADSVIKLLELSGINGKIIGKVT